ncbi:alpha/beta hydrolase family protein [Sporanaerobacter acetigenes]|uniref:Alpha/beta hydrolase family protein n=1 Tax=Sporanaerobacter acetigenes DSM 13106 TaxID=1123281 RepID=A0A1M5YEA8_9FIRM|nr:CocE/NonD family hydrolase [Sporanaerobacter acetigenes]SHI10400.1 Alpha/beta hydrolase family protein [Sporanaerobacter acetigenes DSM 13106]
MDNKKKNFRILAISLVLCLISMIGASAVQTSGGRVEIKDLRWETPSGHLMSALLFIPENATKDTPAPAIITSHGWYNNREMQDLNYVEYSRRGYVVMSIDMYGHGNSDAVTPEEWENRGTGMYDAVELMSSLPYVDKTRIGVTGHSNGARAANWSIKDDNLKEKDEQLISAVLLIGNDAMYTNDPGEPLYWAFRTDEQEYDNVYGNRDVGIIAAQYDEFFFRSKTENGGYTVPRDYLKTEYAQSFLNFGVDPKVEGETRTSETIYKQEVDGETSSRVIYNPAQIHPWNHFSAKCASYGIEFFEDAFGAPNPISSSSQIWQFKVLFNLIGLIGFIMFIVSFTKAMLYTRAFESLRASEEVTIAPAPAAEGKAWFWGGLIVSTIISGFTYIKLFNATMSSIPSFFPQEPVYFIGIWSAVMGVVTLLIMLLSYKLYGKKQGVDLHENGVAISSKNLLKTIGLSLIVVVVSFALVFIADYFFKTDFRIWVIAIKAFTPDKIAITLRYLPLFLIFYIANSMSVNSFNYVSIGKKEWMNTAVLALFNGLSAIVIVAMQYITFFKTGDVFFKSISTIAEIWLFPIVVILPLAAVVSRKIYRATNNPYLAGIINAIVVTLMTCTNTLTQL